MTNDILVLNLNHVNYATADKQVDKYYKGFEVNILQNDVEGWDEYAISTNGKKEYKIFTKYNEDDTYSLKVYEVVEVHHIKVIKTDGDNFITKINGTHSEILEHYNNYNCYCDDIENKQIQEIEFLSEKNKICYLFTVDQRGLFQY